MSDPAWRRCAECDLEHFELKGARFVNGRGPLCKGCGQKEIRRGARKGRYTFQFREG